ncbi:MAG: PKD domain-containing protein [Salibacteraceae bacterium]
MNKHILTLFIAASAVISSIQAQRAVCPQDTIKYIISAKATNFDTLEINPTTTSAVYQYFEAPQDITVDGVRFYGYLNDTTSTGDSSIYITVEIRNVNQDSIPGNTLYATDSILISIPDSTTGSFNQYAHVVTWNPVIVNGPYAVIIKTNINNPNYKLFHTNLPSSGNGDGDGEWLSGAFQGAGWVRSYIYNPTGVPFDADFFFEPIVRYDLDASFINDPECLFDELGDTVQFINDGSAIVDSKMYNRYAAFNFPDGQTWNFGDGSPVVPIINPAHFYPTNGPFAATLTAKILSWTQQVCQDNVTQIIKEKPAQDFSYSTNNLDVDFTNKTFGLFTNISWNFGDGNTSLSENPKHKYSKPGTYWVCQSMMTSCGEITECRNVAVATNTSLNCGKDSVRYTSARSTDTRTITLRNPSSGQKLLGVGQRFPVHQSMIVHGFTFYANHSGLFRDSYEVQCKIWRRAGNNLPDTAIGALAESKVRINKFDVDTNYSDTLRYTAIFDKPVNLVTGEDFILTIEYDSTVQVYISTNDWAEGDGDQDLLAVGKINDSTWVTPASVAAFNVNGQAFDADVIIEPLIEYNLDANFEWPFECMSFDANGNADVTFTDLSSRIVRSEVYNTKAYFGSNVEAFEWDFGDSTGISNQINAIHLFEAPGPFNVSLTVLMEGWTNDCQSTQVLNMPVPPTGGFDYEQVTSEVKFEDLSHNADEYWWTFSDSTYSSLSDPTHYFTRVGEFEVCQYVSNVCGSDTTCEIITINVVGIPDEFISDLKVYPNPAIDHLQIEADLSEMRKLSIEIQDMSGRVVKRFETKEARVTSNIYVGDLARGSYILKLTAGDYTGTRKIVLNR